MKSGRDHKSTIYYVCGCGCAAHQFHWIRIQPCGMGLSDDIILGASMLHAYDYQLLSFLPKELNIHINTYSTRTERQKK